MMNLNSLLKDYIDFLNNALPFCRATLSQTKYGEDILHDWFQANWEMIVESALFYGSKRYLPIYGQGADLATGSSRVSNPDAVATDKIYCTSSEPVYDYISKNHVDVRQLEFEEFVGWDSDWYSVECALDCVLLSDDNEEYVVSIDTIQFALKPV